MTSATSVSPPSPGRIELELVTDAAWLVTGPELPYPARDRCKSTQPSKEERS
jgi:hypothetical protein